MSPTLKKILDTGERALKTAAQTFLALQIANPVFDVGGLHTDAAKKLSIAAIAAGWSALMSGFSLLLGNRETASALPAKADPATPS